MPIPKSTVESSPRKLLRDVVFEKMLAAIQDGTLQPGERLNDDELVGWLGVSRTPIREAIAKLVDFGLVEMEANRYTRIASPTPKQYDDAFQMLFGCTELAARWSFPKLTDDELATFNTMLDATAAHAAAADHAVNTDISAIITFLVTRSGNELMVKLSESLIARARFVRAGAPDVVFSNLGDRIEAMRRAAADRDGEAGAAALRALGEGITADLAPAKAAVA